MDAFDYIIIGAGTSGSVLANRLAADGRTTLCVLEAGPPDRNPYIHIPGGFMKTLFDPAVTWQLALEPSAGTNGRRITVAQGRTLGGSSAVNGMIYNRGQAADWDHFAQLGNPGWGYADVLPLFKRSERRIGPGDAHYRGREGEMVISTTPWTHPLLEAFMRGAEEAGYPRNPDYNGATQFGTGRMQSAIHRARRVSTATAFLKPALRGGRIDLRTGAQVTGIEFSGRRATGVAFRRAGVQSRITARRGVIVAAGALASPKLLQLAGIGPASLLAEHGIAVRQDLPGVGENLRDHFGCRVVAKVRNTDSVNSRVRLPRLAWEALKCALALPSVLGNSPGMVHAFGKSNPAYDNPDFYLTFMPASFKAGFIGRLDDYPGVTCAASPSRPESRGTLRIAGPDPLAPPVIQPNYLADEYDRRIALAAAREARRLLQAPAMQHYFAAEVLPGPAVQSDDEMLDFIRGNAMSGYHFCGTCKMGPETDRMAVVDATLAVHGLQGLYVADCSVLPRTPSGNTAAAAVLIGEKAADMLRAGAAKE